MKFDWAYAREAVNTAKKPYVFATRKSQEHPILLLEKDDQDDDRGIIISGRNMRDCDELNRTISDAFSFPAYFGNNWDAMDECMSDLSWLPFKKFLLVVSDAEEVLIRQPNEFEIFVSVLENASRFWADPASDRSITPKESPRSFHTVFVLPNQYKGTRGLELLRQ